MEKLSKRSTRAIQTLFRTLSKNNYALEEMIDRKASIMITTNAIIISVILGSSLCQNLVDNIDAGLILILLAIWVVSIIFALYCIKPFLVRPFIGRPVDSKLLNLHRVDQSSLTDYKAKVFHTLQHENEIYESMTEDIYQIGKNIKRKHFYLSISAYAFLTGVIISVLFFAYHFVM